MVPYLPILLASNRTGLPYQLPLCLAISMAILSGEKCLTPDYVGAVPLGNCLCLRRAIANGNYRVPGYVLPFGRWSCLIG